MPEPAKPGLGKTEAPDARGRLAGAGSPIPPALPIPPLAPIADLGEIAGRPPDPPVSIPLRIEDTLSVICMGLLVAITFINVVVRYLTSYSFAWTEEISITVMVVMTLAAASAATARERHIRIDYFHDRAMPARRRRLVMFSAAVVCLFFTILTVLSGRVVWDDLQYGETSPGIGVPIWWYSVWTPLLSLAIAGRSLAVLMRAAAARPEDAGGPDAVHPAGTRPSGTQPSATHSSGTQASGAQPSAAPPPAPRPPGSGR